MIPCGSNFCEIDSDQPPLLCGKNKYRLNGQCIDQCSKLIHLFDGKNCLGKLLSYLTLN